MGVGFEHENHARVASTSNGDGDHGHSRWAPTPLVASTEAASGRMKRRFLLTIRLRRITFTAQKPKA